jgi:hypothetical protein
MSAPTITVTELHERRRQGDRHDLIDMFAGITDTCGMRMLFARMPWNQVGPVGSDAKEVPCDR